MVDLTLGRDATVSVGFKVYSRKFSEDVLLEGGRVSRTTDLAPGARQGYPVGAVIPADTAPGAYHLCAFVDPGNVLPETDERNNSRCVPLRVLPASQSGKLADSAEPNRPKEKPVSDPRRSLQRPRRRDAWRAVAGLVTLLVAVDVPAGFLGTDLFIPSVGRAQGIATWYTTIWLHNPGSEPAYAGLTFLERNRDNTGAAETCRHRPR